MESDRHYHVYNRANGNEKLFLTTAHYEFFLRKYKQHISPICDTFCYCLMPNHFHLLIKIKSLKELAKISSFAKSDSENYFIGKQFSNLFSSYTQSLNKEQGRKGNLFMRPFKRKEINDEVYLRKLIHYIHFNAVEAGLAVSPKDWPHSSYNSILSDRPTSLERSEVINYFDTIENFVYVHTKPPNISGIEEL